MSLIADLQSPPAEEIASLLKEEGAGPVGPGAMESIEESGEAEMKEEPQAGSSEQVGSPCSCPPDAVYTVPVFSMRKARRGIRLHPYFNWKSLEIRNGQSKFII